MKKILLISYNDALSDLYRDKFYEQGFDVLLGSDGDDVIRHLENNRPDVILIDPLLPGINGVEIIRYIRSRDSLRNMPVILLSDLSHMSGMVQAAWQAGASSFLKRSDATPEAAVSEVRRVLEAAENMVNEHTFKDLSDYRSVNVLLADDDRTIHSILEFHLTQAGIAMRSAFNGKEALAKAELDPPDLLILDVMMPGLDGFKVLETWRGHKSLCKIPVIMLTVWGDDADMVGNLQNGADAYFTKPFSPSDLLKKLRFLTSPCQSQCFVAN